MMKAYEYRIYPTSQQEEIFNQTLGLCRLYWNTVVFNKNQDHNFQIEGYKQIFTKYKPEALKWSKEAACSIPLSQMWSDVRAAYTNSQCNPPAVSLLPFATSPALHIPVSETLS